MNCAETTHGSHSLSVSRTVCAALRHAYVARPCTRFLLAPFEFASTHCVPELGHCVPCARSRWNIGRPLLHECTSRTVLHTPAAFPWAATAGQRPSARLPTQPGPGAGPIATERVGAAGSSTPRGASASRTVNGSPSPRASSRTHVTGPTRIRQKPLELLPRVWHLHGPRCVLYFLGSMEVHDGPGSGRKDMHLHS